MHFLGLWDTVGALAFGGLMNNFHLTSPATVKHVAHALTLDELRDAFSPEYWERSGTDTDVDEERGNPVEFRRPVQSRVERDNLQRLLESVRDDLERAVPADDTAAKRDHAN